LIRTESVGLAWPDSRFAHVGRGTSASRAICSWVIPRAPHGVGGHWRQDEMQSSRS
jgi:hypothetical protein